jgi:hypothetical protein
MARSLEFNVGCRPVSVRAETDTFPARVELYVTWLWPIPLSLNSSECEMLETALRQSRCWVERADAKYDKGE